jgi:MYXO-CTERM domain-containing protein
MASPVVYDFDVTAGSISLQIIGQGSTNTSMGGTFGITIYQSDAHIGESDTFVLGVSGLTNTGTAALNLLGLATATLLPGGARVLEFIQPDPGHIGPGGVAHIMTDAYLEATVLITGAFTTTFDTSTQAGILLPVDVGITTSVMESDIVTATIGISFPYAVGIPDFNTTITLDLIVQVTGTAHVVPDPALGGLTALGLGGAGAWLRRRRS